jgi:hypothetical protein
MKHMYVYQDFENRLSTLDIKIFEKIAAELNTEDRKALLLIQKAIRDDSDAYCYLEIGSHLGGSIQPYLLDQRCNKIYSVDKRPCAIPDDRGAAVEYPNNSTERMLSLLKEISPDDVSKIVCFDSDAKDVAPRLIEEKPDICFIDGEHTRQAVVSDFAFCLSVVKKDGLICFHDSEIVWKGLNDIVRDLKARKIEFQFAKLGGAVSVIGFNSSVLHRSATLNRSIHSNWRFFLLQQRTRHLYKKYFDYKIVQVLKPGMKKVFQLLRKVI